MKGKRLFDRGTAEARKEHPDHAGIVQLWERSYQLGYAYAGYALGTWYLHGQYIEKDVKKGIRLIKEAAGYGVPEALFDMGVSYETGTGVKQNAERAFMCYMQAALAGDTDSHAEVGRCYYYGIGTPKNRKLAQIWLNKHQQLQNSCR